jgi:hypothetical protein
LGIIDPKALVGPSWEDSKFIALNLTLVSKTRRLGKGWWNLGGRDYVETEGESRNLSTDLSGLLGHGSSWAQMVERGTHPLIQKV